MLVRFFVLRPWDHVPFRAEDEGRCKARQAPNIPHIRSTRVSRPWTAWTDARAPRSSKGGYLIATPDSLGRARYRTDPERKESDQTCKMDDHAWYFHETLPMNARTHHTPPQPGPHPRKVAGIEPVEPELPPPSQPPIIPAAPPERHTPDVPITRPPDAPITPPSEPPTRPHPTSWNIRGGAVDARSYTA